MIIKSDLEKVTVKFNWWAFAIGWVLGSLEIIGDKMFIGLLYVG